MTGPAEQPTTTRLSWQIRICRIGWKIVRYVWVVFFLTVVLPKAVDMLFSDKPLRSLPNLWPILDTIVRHPVWTALIFLGLLFLTGLFWFGSRERPLIAQDTLSERDRLTMLRRLHFRYEQMLTQSLQGTIKIELGLMERSAAVQNMVSLSFHLPNQPDHPLPPHTSIIEAYEQAQQELLILGEPGAGKSTLLLELAQHLVEQAEQDTTQPLPILLPLSSWATNRRPLHEWFVEQTALLYNVPRSLSQQWLQTKHLFPLLDGLDEMEASAHDACIAAINTYHREEPDRLQPLVVCSRTNEYEFAATRERLALHTAVTVQPLSQEQVDTYLTSMGKPLAALRAALRKNRVLRELATTPLMLQVLMLTYNGTSVRELSHKEAQLHEQVWGDYVQHMISRKGDAKRYPLLRTVMWLSWLARQIRQHNQTIFYLENLQPDWLPKRPKAFYQWSVGLLFGLVGGLVSGLLVGLFTELRVGLGVGLGVGLIIGLITIKPIEKFTWSWKKATPGLVSGLFLGLVIVQISDTIIWPLLGLGIGLFLGLLGGLSGKQLTERLTISPNEGIRHSARNGLVIGLISGLAICLGIGLLYVLLVGLNSDLAFALFFGLLLGLLLGPLLGLLLGLGAAIQHYTLRFWLWRTNALPWKVVPFLDDATARILLRRIGGGYIFTHRLLLDYFADLDAQASPTPAAVPSTPSQAP